MAPPALVAPLVLALWAGIAPTAVVGPRTGWAPLSVAIVLAEIDGYVVFGWIGNDVCWGRTVLIPDFSADDGRDGLLRLLLLIRLLRFVLVLELLLHGEGGIGALLIEVDGLLWHLAGLLELRACWREGLRFGERLVGVVG